MSFDMDRFEAAAYIVTELPQKAHILIPGCSFLGRCCCLEGGNLLLDVGKHVILGAVSVELSHAAGENICTFRVNF